jgi:hypothetical protein
MGLGLTAVMGVPTCGVIHLDRHFGSLAQTTLGVHRHTYPRGGAGVPTLTSPPDGQSAVHTV